MYILLRFFANPIHMAKQVFHPPMTASLAQWQSTGLVNQGSRVQSSQEAMKVLFDLNKKNLQRQNEC